MSAERFDPVTEFVVIRDSLGRAVERSIRQVTGAAGFPAVDMYEDDVNLYIRTEPMLGLRAESIDVDIDGGILTLSGETVDPQPEETRFVYRELRFGPFSRKLRLPRLVDVQNAQARLRDGVLTVILPKAKHTASSIVDVTPAE